MNKDYFPRRVLQRSQQSQSGRAHPDDERPVRAPLPHHGERQARGRRHSPEVHHDRRYDYFYSLFSLKFDLICLLSKGQPRTKHVDLLMSQLCHSRVQFFFTDCQEESAAVVASLLKREAKRGYELPRPFSLTKHQERVLLPFYQVNCLALWGFEGSLGRNLR